MAFRNRAQLGTVPLLPIDVTEMGTSLEVGTSARVWTGTLRGGTASTATCENWENNLDNVFAGQVGSANSADAWTESTLVRCDERNRVYCFER